MNAKVPVLVLLLCIGCSGAEKRKAIHDKGLLAWENGKPDKAVKTFNEGLTTFPDAHAMRLSLARIHYERGEGPHLEQRRAINEADSAHERKDFEREQELRDESDSRKREATLEYKVASEHLDKIIKDCDDDEILAHALILRARLSVFFEDYMSASKQVRLYIEKAGLEGVKRAKCERFATECEERALKPLLPERSTRGSPFD